MENLFVSMGLVWNQHKKKPQKKKKNDVPRDNRTHDFSIQPFENRDR
jgi:hypothetical protein